MRILFLPVVAPHKAVENSAKLASARYRALIPAQALRDAGHDVELRPMLSLVQADFATDADVVVVSQPKTEILRVENAMPASLAAVERLGRRGATVIVDVCDFKFGPQYAAMLTHSFGADAASRSEDYLRRLLLLADAVTVPTAELGARLQQALAAPLDLHVVGDPVEVSRGEARFSPGATLRLLWFGSIGQHAAALRAFLRAEAPAIAARHAAELLILCESLDPADQASLERPPCPGFAVRAAAWSLAALEAALARCDAAIMPFLADPETALNKSNNRAVQALQAGRFVLANPIPSYRELDAYCHVGNSIAAGLRAALDDPAAVVERVRRGQVFAAAHHAPAAVGARWAEIFSGVVR